MAIVPTNLCVNNIGKTGSPVHCLLTPTNELESHCEGLRYVYYEGAGESRMFVEVLANDDADLVIERNQVIGFLSFFKENPLGTSLKRAQV